MLSAVIALRHSGAGLFTLTADFSADEGCVELIFPSEGVSFPADCTAPTSRAPEGDIDGEAFVFVSSAVEVLFPLDCSAAEAPSSADRTTSYDVESVGG